MQHRNTLIVVLPVCLGVAALTACGGGGDDTTANGTTADDSTTTTAPDPTTGPGPGPTVDTEPTPDDTTDGTVGATGTSGTSETGVTTAETATTEDLLTGTDTEADTESGTDTATTGHTPMCGDGVKEGTEACDDGNDIEDDGCEPNCTVTAKCGNGMVEVGEVCDDGNTKDDDECSGNCLEDTSQQICGDGVLKAPEICDDGNNADGDGCQADCTPTPSVCGNSVKEPGEACDDGNDVPDDFCTNECQNHVPDSCGAPAMYTVCDADLSLTDKADKTAVHKAMGICNLTDADSVKITNYAFEGPDNESWQIARGFGTYKVDHDNNPATAKQLLYRPREGGSFLMLSTGNIAAPDAMGIVTEAPNTQSGNGSNDNPNIPKSMPLPLHDEMGSNNGNGGTPFMACDGVNDCSDTLFNQWNNIAFQNPNDKLFFKFDVTVPEGTHGYQFDFVFCSSEYPMWVGDPYNDMFIVWQTDPAPDAYTGNITFIPDPQDPTKGLPLTITALQDYYAGPGYTDAEDPLDGTGFENGACSDWFTAKGGVQPGSNVTIGFFLTDMGDDGWASLAIVDNFRWDCVGCMPTEVNDCGVNPPQ